MKGTTVLYGPMTHPQFLRALATAGHGSKILLADANYPHKTGVGPACELVSLNYAPGMLDVIQVLRVLKRTIPIESVEIMVPDPAAEPVGIPIHDEFKEELPDVEFSSLTRFDFYDAARSWRRRAGRLAAGGIRIGPARRFRALSEQKGVLCALRPLERPMCPATAETVCG